MAVSLCCSKMRVAIIDHDTNQKQSEQCYILNVGQLIIFGYYA